MLTTSHQAISRVLFLALLAATRRIGGDVFYAPLRIEVRPGKFREPDLLLVLDTYDPRAQDEYWTGADLVMEIVCPDTTSSTRSRFGETADTSRFGSSNSTAEGRTL
jgi:Uma2 family endonuclease